MLFIWFRIPEIQFTYCTGLMLLSREPLPWFTWLNQSVNFYRNHAFQVRSHADLFWFSVHGLLSTTWLTIMHWFDAIWMIRSYSKNENLICVCVWCASRSSLFDPGDEDSYSQWSLSKPMRDRLVFLRQPFALLFFFNEPCNLVFAQSLPVRIFVYISVASREECPILMWIKVIFYLFYTW